MSEPFAPAFQKVDLGTRLGARLLDGLILLVPVLLVTAPIAGGFQIGSGNTGGKRVVATVLGVVLSYLYFVVCEATRGATFGKQACRIRVVGPDGATPSFAQAARRHVYMFVSVVPAGLGGLLTLLACVGVGVTISKDPAGRGFHDHWAGTIVLARS